MRVLTLNLWGRDGDSEAAGRCCATGSRDLAPDLVAFQEALVEDGYDPVARDRLFANRGPQSLDGMSVSYLDAWEACHPGVAGHTLSARNPLRPGRETGRRADYVLVGCDDHAPTLTVTACGLAFDEPVESVWGSDHFGVVADLAAPGP